MGAGRFAEVLKREISRNDWDKHTFKFVGDPAGNQMAQTSEQTPFMILRAAGINAQPAPSNDAIMRVEAVEGVLNRMSDGYPAMKISPSCVVLISGFEGGYQYKRTYNMGQERYDEDRVKIGSHIYMTPYSMRSWVVVKDGESCSGWLSPLPIQPLKGLVHL